MKPLALHKEGKEGGRGEGGRGWGMVGTYG